MSEGIYSLMCLVLSGPLPCLCWCLCFNRGAATEGRRFVVCLFAHGMHERQVHFQSLD